MEGIKIRWIDHDGVSYVGTQEHLNELVEEALANGYDITVHLEEGKMEVRNGKFNIVQGN